MALFLQRKNNLKDVEDVYEARNNLGIGTMGYQDSNDVNISGGNVRLDELVLRSSNAQQGRFVVCASNDGRVDFVDLELGDWIHKDPSEINIGEFDHAGFVFLNRESVCNLVFTADYNDILTNRPNLYSDLQNDQTYLYNDLRNVDRAAALSNLGIGTLAFRQSNDTIQFDRLIVTNALVMATPSNTDSDTTLFMQVRNDGNVFLDALPRATETTYGVVRLTSDIHYGDPTHVPTLQAVNAMHTVLSSRIDGIEAGDISQAVNIVQTINNNGLLSKTNNLSELSDFVAARSNLGFGSNMQALIERVNTSNVFSVGNLRVTSNIIFQQGETTSINGLEAELIENGAYLAINADGNVKPQNLPMATSSTPGFVYIRDYYDYTEELVLPHDRSTVLSVSAFDSFINGVYIPLYNSVSNNIEPKIRDMYHEFMQVKDNLRVDNPSLARQHLQLHELAHTADFFQLTNRPTTLSAFENTPGFLESSLNLSDVLDIADARSNLGLGSMALYDSNNVTFVRGNGSFSNMVVRDHLTYKYDSLDHQGHFLKCINTLGDSRWEPLPVATSTRKGIVRLESDFESSASDRASSGAALYTVYTKLKSEISLLQREVDALRASIAATE